MILTRFEASGFRNLDGLVIEPHPALTLLKGDNGSGKSSVLEAIHCLATGYTFRTRRVRDYLHFERDELTLAGQLKDPRDGKEHRCGLARKRDGEINLRVNYASASSFTEVAALVPVKALTPDSHGLVEDGPEERRRFLDWGCFHGSEEFLPIWRRYKRALNQRNESLRRLASDAEVCSWNEALASDGNALTRIRKSYVAELAIHVKNRAQVIDFPFHMELALRPGWDESDGSLDELLVRKLETHRRMKTTTDGPHRADIQIKADGVLARQHLSRGQQKVLVYLLHLAQLDCLRPERSANAIVLCDDLGAELDSDNAERIIGQLLSSGHQALVTGTQATPQSLVERCEGSSGAVVHMSGGIARP